MPPILLKQLGIEVGSQLSLDVDNGTLIVRPTVVKQKKRYSLSQLLKGVTAVKMKKLNHETKESCDGNSVGHELP